MQRLNCELSKWSLGEAATRRRQEETAMIQQEKGGRKSRGRVSGPSLPGPEESGHLGPGQEEESDS